jgi:cold shock CspA family protein
MNTTSKDKFGRRPEFPWLWSAAPGASKREYVKLKPLAPYFLDDSERQWRMIEEMKAERAGLYEAIVSIFNSDSVHSARVEHVEKDCYIHVKAIQDEDAIMAIPGLTEGVDVKFGFVESGRNA